MKRSRLLLVPAGLALGLAVGELTARIVLPLLPDPAGTAWVKDPHCGYRLRPTAPGELPPDHDDFINSLGFRDREHPRVKPPGTCRILGIGDSFVYGAVPPRENFLRVAQDRLNALVPGLNAEVMLLGAPGYDTRNETALLRELGPHLAPDLVILNFFVGNDVTGIPVRGKVIRGRMYFTHSPLWWLNLARKSQFFQLAEGAVYRVWKQERTAAAAAAAPAAPTSAAYLQILRQNLPVYLARPDGRLHDLWRQAEAALAEFAAQCRALGVPWLLVLIPAEEQVDPAVRQWALSGLDLAAADYDFDAPQRRLRDWAAARGVRVLDLLPMMRAAHGPQDPLYLPRDTHWNARGNAEAGRLLGEEVARVMGADAGG